MQSVNHQEIQLNEPFCITKHILKKKDILKFQFNSQLDDTALMPYSFHL